MMGIEEEEEVIGGMGEDMEGKVKEDVVGEYVGEDLGEVGKLYVWK